MNKNPTLVLMGHADGFGGAQTAFRKMIVFLKGEHYNLRLIFISDELVYADEAKELLGIVRHKAKGFKKILKFIQLIKAGLALRIIKPDLFITIGLSSSANFLIRFLAKKAFTIGQDFIANRPVNDALYVNSLHAFKGIVVQSPSMLDNLPVKRTSKTNWLPCFPNEPIKGITKSKWEKNGLKFCYFGRLAGNKGLDLAIKSFYESIILKDVSFEIWGQGSEEEKLKKLVSELSLNNQVIFKGPYPSGEDGARLMVSYDALILTSTDTEGLPLTLLESMAYGLPFVTTNIGAIKDCCVDNPDVILIEPNLKSIQNGLELMKSKLLSNEININRLKDYYQENFSTEIMKKRWINCITNPQTFFDECK